MTSFSLSCWLSTHIVLREGVRNLTVVVRKLAKRTWKLVEGVWKVPQILHTSQNRCQKTAIFRRDHCIETCYLLGSTFFYESILYVKRNLPKEKALHSITKSVRVGNFCATTYNLQYPKKLMWFFCVNLVWTFHFVAAARCGKISYNFCS